MQQRWFDQYQFDLNTLRLSHSGEQVALRPKAAKILKLLLENPGEVVSKAVLLEQVWGSRLVADQNLFQAISELRNTFSPLEPVLTQPNLGYAWCQPTQLAQPAQNGFQPRWVAAAALAAVIGLAGLFNQAGSRSSTPALLSPALQAFNLGLIELGQHPHKAVKLFALSIQENPEFLESRLMLAQSLLLAGEVDKARTEAEHLYVLAVDRQLDYLQVGVMGLMSRLDELSGRQSPALNWAQSAVEKAAEKGFVCAADDAQRRLTDLMAQQPNEPAAPLPTQPTSAARRALVATLPGKQPCNPLLGEADPNEPQASPAAIS